MADTTAAVTYGNYLKIDELLSLQQPRSEGPEHDELLFIIIHQVYELWFKELLHEFDRVARLLTGDEPHRAQHTLKRILTILKVMVAQLDILETMTPKQFAAFRPELGTASGFQSQQFRVIEATLGKREFPEPIEDPQLREAIRRRSVFDSLLYYLAKSGWDVPTELLDRDPSQPSRSDPLVQALLREVYADEREPAELCEALVDIDEGIMEWRYRHVMMVQRIIGTRTGTGGSAGAAYLRSTLFQPAFPELWEVRGG